MSDDVESASLPWHHHESVTHGLVWSIIGCMRYYVMWEFKRYGYNRSIPQNNKTQQSGNREHIYCMNWSWWRHQMETFPRYWPFVWGIHRSPVNSPHKGQWRGALMFSLICTRTNSWVHNRDAGDFRRHRADYDGTRHCNGYVQHGIWYSLILIRLSWIISI